jgi:DNA-binding NtrC family response regulator
LKEENSSYDIFEASDGLLAIEFIKNQDFDLILCDIKMPKMDGLEVLEATKKIKPDIPIVMISGHGDLETAVETMRHGAYDYISKPPDLNRLLNTVRNALDRKKLLKENKILKQRVDKKYEMIGHSDQIQDVKSVIDKVAPTEARVLITGPNGTGKELVAHWLHQKSNRSSGSLVEVNCAAIPSELIESELFGHLKGAFTSANKDRAGKFEAANEGTLFLDEIGDMSLPAQAKVLRALQENKIQRVGSDKDIKVNVRIIAATNKDLKKEILEGRFREDLYHRLAVILIKVPSLNDRREDIPLLINFFSSQISIEQGTATKHFSEKAMNLLKSYDWTGNVRELRNVVERLIILGSDEISDSDVKLYAQKK